VRDVAGDLAARVSVVLLTHNCDRWLPSTLAHLAELRLPIIAVDNASTDRTGELLRSQAGVDVVQLTDNIGAAARNVGISRARTPYVACCDDDGWHERDGLQLAADLLDRHPRLGLVNARILVRDEQSLDPISAEMAASPLPDEHGIPGKVLIGFMAGACVVRVAAYQEVGGYDPRVFIGGEEETLAFKLARAGWQMRYAPDAVVHHYPSLANAPHLRDYGIRNTIWNAWLHRRLGSALRWTGFTVAASPKNRDLVRGLLMAVAGMPWVLRERRPMPADLDDRLRVLDRRRFRGETPVRRR
jgi:GT2 family glycosyltransferase